MSKFELAVKHGANLGDVIYTLWSVKELSETMGEPVVYYQWLNRPAFYYEGAKHPTLDKTGRNVSMNESGFEMLKPLMESLPYIKAFLPWEGRKAINLDKIRDLNIGMPFGDIRKWYGYAYPELVIDISKKVINPTGTLVATRKSIIANFTSRYRNPAISYGFLQDLPSNVQIIFVGILEEYDEFLKEVPRAKHATFTNFLDLSNFLYSNHREGGLFIGNQSFCFALAEAMKIDRALEVCGFAPNVIVAGDNGFDFYTQEALEWRVQQFLSNE